MKEKQLTSNFNLSEFHCIDRHNKTLLLVAEVPYRYESRIETLAKNLQVLRDYLKAVITVNSAYRSPWYNKQVGGKPKSQHPECTAGDITAEGYTPDEVADAIEHLIAEGKMDEGGLGRYNGFTHYDNRGKRARWDNR